MKICILMGSADISGGSLVIFEHAVYLQDRGDDVTIVTLEPPSSAADWHPALRVLRFRTFAEIADTRFDLAIATWWKTVYQLATVDAARYCYFVQSIETRFYPEHDRPLQELVEATYRLELTVITEARWIASYLERRFGTAAFLVQNGCNKNIFSREGAAEAPRGGGRLRVLVEGALGVPFKNVARTIALLRRSSADEIWLLTNSDIDRYPGVQRVFSRVPSRRCADIYRSCDVLVKLSYVEGMFGPPLEMFHCGGTAVVYDVTGFDEYIVDGVNGLVVRTGDEDAVVRAVNRLNDDRALLARLIEGASATARQWPGWPEASSAFKAAIGEIAGSSEFHSRERLASMTGAAWNRYVEQATEEKSRAKSTWLRSATEFGRRVIDHAARRSPTFDRWIRVMHARLIEERWRPPARSY